VFASPPAATAPGSTLVSGLQSLSASLPVAPPAASRRFDELLCDSAVVVEGLGSLSLPSAAFEEPMS
jgi:hypothetical protein